MTLLGYSVPVFVIGPLFIYIFSVRLGWLPTFYTTTHDVQWTSWSSIWFQIKQLLMPVAVLTLFNAASFGRFTRGSVLENLNEQYVRTARSKGVGERTVMSRHVLRNSLIPVVTLLALSIPGIFGGAIITENIFRINGLGQLLLVSIGQNDIPMVQSLGLHLRRPDRASSTSSPTSCTASSTHGFAMTESGLMTQPTNPQAHTSFDSALDGPYNVALDGPTELELGAFRSLRGDVWRQFRRHKGALAGMVILVLIIVRLLRRPGAPAVRHVDAERQRTPTGRRAGPTSGAPTTWAGTPSAACPGRRPHLARWSASSPCSSRSWSACSSACSPASSAESTDC